jgi:hypothetical protein
MGLDLEPNACLKTHRANIGTGVLVPPNVLPARVFDVA